MTTTARARRWTVCAVAALLAPILAAVVDVPGAEPAAAAPRVLHVGSYHGMTGEYATIAAALAAAQPGDWVLVGPGDYKERMDYGGPTPDEAGAAVHITTPGLHLRGMDRNAVIVDGTKAGAPPCSTAEADQDYGPLNAGNEPVGRSGVVVDQADGVSVDNLTACNFLANHGGGNQIWWNGGDGSGTTNLAAFEGSYLSATSQFWQQGKPEAEYGIFVSNVTGPGTVAHTYASNQADASYYVGACPDCNTTLDDAHAQHSALGYSGTNSGGHLIIENSEWDDNKTGVSTNSQNNDDAPSPQEGACPGNGTGPTGTHSCWVFRNNFVHDNNDPNVPGSGTAELGPPGTGIVIAGGRDDTVTGNRFVNNGSWAVLVVPYIDTGTPPPVAHCDGGIWNWVSPGWCYYAPWGNETAHNTFTGNGGFGNETNGDLADLSAPHKPGNCWHDNVDTAGAVTSAPVDLETTNGVCGLVGQGAPILGSPLSQQVLCATEIFGPCPPQPGKEYPRATARTVIPLPAQTTMPDPCAGVPADPWCPPAPSITVTPTTVAPGGSVAVSSTGWQPGSTVVVTVGGTDAGSLTAGADGSVTGTVAIPPGTAAGTVAIVLAGTGYVGAALQLAADVTVTTNATTTVTTTPPTPATVATPVSGNPALTG